MEMMPPRTLSAMYAPVLMDTTISDAIHTPELPWKDTWLSVK